MVEKTQANIQSLPEIEQLEQETQANQVLIDQVEQQKKLADSG